MTFIVKKLQRFDDDLTIALESEKIDFLIRYHFPVDFSKSRKFYQNFIINK